MQDYRRPAPADPLHAALFAEQGFRVNIRAKARCFYRLRRSIEASEKSSSGRIVSNIPISFCRRMANGPRLANRH